MSDSQRPFPHDFLFGAATAAAQIEGATHEDGRTDSVWDAFCREPGAIERGDTLDPACDHYHRYRGDVAIMRELGLDAYRFSTSWARVCPDGGPVNAAGVAFYSRLVDELLEAGIEPWLTLFHWDHPQALEERGGWTTRDTVARFTDYALAVHDALGDRVRHFSTLNEPWCASFLSYTGGVHAPGHRSVAEGMLAAHHLLLGHGEVVRALRERDPALDIGITLNLAPAEPADPSLAADIDAARRIDGQFNRFFLDPLFSGGYPADVLADVREVDPDAVDLFESAVQRGDLAIIGAPIDFLGVNYYHGEYVGGTPPIHAPIAVAPAVSRATRSPFPAAANVHWHERGLPRTVMGWEVQPSGLTDLLRRVRDDYTGQLPLYVTENGAAYDDVVSGPGVDLGAGVDGGAGVDPAKMQVIDPERTSYLIGHLGAVLDAIDHGIDVRGYFYWSLMDNFEWTWGYAKRFGIVYVDFATQQRVIKESGRAYADVISARALKADA